MCVPRRIHRTFYNFSRETVGKIEKNVLNNVPTRTNFPRKTSLLQKLRLGLLLVEILITYIHLYTRVPIYLYTHIYVYVV